MIRAVLFDLEDTLVLRESYAEEVDAVIHQEVARILSCTAQQAKGALENARFRSQTTTMALESLGLSRHVLYDRLNRLEVKSSTAATKEAPVALELLSKRGMKLAIITNMPRLLTIKILEAAGIQPSVFDVLVTGSDAERLKPAKEPFLTALCFLGIPATECIMVGDREDVDIRPALELGMITVVFDSRRELAHYQVSALIEVVDMVDALNGSSRSKPCC